MPKRLERSRLAQAIGLAFCMSWMAVAMAAQTDVTFNASLSETLTDNSRAARDNDSDVELISAATAGVDAKAKGAGTEGKLGLRVSSVSYHQDSSRNTVYVTGSGRARSELVDNRLFLDLGGNVSRRNTSAFRTTSVDGEIDGGNRELVRTFFVSPQLQFRLGREIRGTASHRATWTTGGSAIEGTRREMVTALGLNNPTAFGPLGWSVDYAQTRTKNNVRTGNADLRVLRAALTYAVTDRLSFSLTGGREENDYETGDDLSSTIRGAGFNWVLSPRTRLSANVEKRFFGTGYDYLLTHSRPLSSLQVRYSRDVSSIENTQQLSLSELAFREFFIGLASSIPDPVERAQVAASLAATIPNGDSSFVDFVTSSFSVNRRFSLSGALVGARNVLSLALTRSDSERLGQVDTLDPNDDFSIFSRIKTSGATLSLSHRVSGNSSLATGLSYSRSEGEGTGTASTTRRTATVSYNTSLGARTSASLSLRRQHSTGTSSFEEHALVGTVRMHF